MRHILPMLFLILCGCATNQHVSNTSLVSTAEQFVHMNEVDDRHILTELMNVDPVNIAWCASFVNAILRLNNLPVSDELLLARSFTSWGQEVSRENIREGDIVVFPRGDEDWQGHVGFYIKTEIINDIEYYIILGGNQNNEVSYKEYRASNAIAIRRRL